MITHISTWLERIGVVLAGMALFAIMILTFFDVIGRKLLSNSITGSLELTELLMAAVIFGALPAVSRHDGHIQFDSLDACLSTKVRAAQKVLIALIAAVLLFGLGCLMWKTGGQFFATGETTAQLQILKAPFIYAMAILCWITAFMHFAVLLGDTAKIPAGSEGTAL